MKNGDYESKNIKKKWNLKNVFFINNFRDNIIYAFF
jgi:hypothetical protein